MHDSICPFCKKKIERDKYFSSKYDQKRGIYHGRKKMLYRTGITRDTWSQSFDNL